MKPNVDLVASARQAASFLGLLALTISPALAGDRALVDFIGFSPDAKYFAFEEFGIQDGSGFAYSNIYVVDLATDSWLEGTPIRLQAESEDKPLLQLRSEANSQALRIIADKEIFLPVDIAALIGDGSVGSDGKELAFGIPGYERGTVDETRHLKLETFDAKTAQDCSLWFDNQPQGFALSLAGEGGNLTLHRDETLPRSRGCAFDYRIYAVVLPGLDAPRDRGVVIVSVYPGGFEGPDRRFLAVPLAL